MSANGTNFLYDLYKDSRTDEIIKGYLQSNISFYLHGPTGVGKSSRVKSIDPNCIVIYLRNAEPELIVGKTVYVEPIEGISDSNNFEDGMDDIKPNWLNKLEKLCNEDKEHLHVVFFDELSNAFPSIQGLIFNIMLSKEVNGIWRLPSNARVVAAGNEMSDSLAANDISKPLYSRLAHIYLKDNYKEWINWACKKGLHPAVIAFIAETKMEYLRTEYTGITPNADPRKWEMVSNVLYKSGNINVLNTLIDKKSFNAFVNFCMTPLVPIQSIIENNLWSECRDSLKGLNNSSNIHAFIANMSFCPPEYIHKCFPIIESLGLNYLALFSKMWVHGDPTRLSIIQELYSNNVNKNRVFTKK